MALGNTRASSAHPLKVLLRVALETVLVLVWLTTECSLRFRLERRRLPFPTPLSSVESVLGFFFFFFFNRNASEASRHFCIAMVQAIL